MYLTSPGLKVLAVDPATGQRLWEFDPWEGRGGRGVNRGVTYWSDGTDQRIFFTGGTFLYALNASTAMSFTSTSPPARRASSTKTC
jgi:quinoprotein glucose dehydrogenase